MKVGVVTITNGPCNYGNQLQNYAVLKTFEKMGIDAETLYNVHNAKYKVSLKHKIKNRLLIALRMGNHLRAKKEVAFDRFSKRYLNYTRPMDDDVPEELISRFDYFIAGSDQVWNPIFSISHEHWRYLLLDFAPAGKRVSYSASIGVPTISEGYQKDFKDALSKYVAISVREEAGAKTIRNLVGRDADVLIDPTLFLGVYDWEKLSQKPKKVDCDGKYILTYFLGGRSDRVNQDIHKYLKQGWSVYHLLDESQPHVFTVDPSNFIYLIAHAQLILTDSFHACVFSFLFDRPFLVYDRENVEGSMMSRLDTFLGKFDLRRKFADSGLSNQVFEQDYSHGKEVLSHERVKVESFIRKALGVNI